MPEFCSIEKADHVMTVTLERPDRLNALHPPANIELGEVFDDFASDDEMWVAVITGRGRHALLTQRFVLRAARLVGLWHYQSRRIPQGGHHPLHGQFRIACQRCALTGCFIGVKYTRRRRDKSTHHQARNEQGHDRFDERETSLPGDLHG